MTSQPATAHSVAFLFDVDDTLFDNDRFEQHVGQWLDREVGPGSAERYWHAFEARRQQLDFADFIGSLQDCWEASGRDPRWLPAGDFLLDYPFDTLVYPGAFDAIDQLARHGPVWLISDGDGVMQPRKLRRSGLWHAVNGRVRIFIHKETRLAEIQEACRAEHKVFIDDKRRILDAVKAQWGAHVTTVQPLQGHYAMRPTQPDRYRQPDHVLERIGALAAPDNAVLSTLKPESDLNPNLKTS